MTNSNKNVAAERKVIQRTSHALAEVTARLRMLGLYGVDIGDDGHCARAKVSAESRRELLIFLSELEEMVKEMEAFASDIASSIAMHDRNQDAVAAYRQTGAAYRQYRRKGKN